MVNENNSISQIANRKPAISEVDALADELIKQFNNPDYRPWYCRVIYELGITEVYELMNRVRDAKNPGTLFSKIASERLKQKAVREQVYGKE